MTNKLKCPFCQIELEQTNDKKMLSCPKCLHIADDVFWVKMIQVKQDFDILKKALISARDTLDFCWGNYYTLAAKHEMEDIDKTLTHIEHKDGIEQKDK